MTAEVEDVAAEEAPELDRGDLERRREALGEVRQFGDPVLKSRASEVQTSTPSSQPRPSG